MNKELPQIIKDVGFDFSWSEEKVWALSVPVEDMDIKELEWHFEIPFWSTTDGFYDLTPNRVLKEPETYRDEFERILKADTNYPLDIMFWKSRWLLLDGLHRLVKLKQQNIETIKVRKIPVDFISKISK